MTAIADCGHKGLAGVKPLLVSCGECYDLVMKRSAHALRLVEAAQRMAKTLAWIDRERDIDLNAAREVARGRLADWHRAVEEAGGGCSEKA